VKRRFFLKAVVAAICSVYLTRLPAQSITIGTGYQIASPLTFTPSTLLTSAGRIGFYIDYSELKAPGEHVFYACRTHGAEGEVSVEYSSHGDPHTASTGTITWADGDISIKSFKVVVPNKTSAGEHRVHVDLQNPTGGAALHQGEFTRAYGVIDDDTIADDSLALFYDATATTNGNGTQAAPYNNLYDAIANIGNKRYLYGKGTSIVDGTNTCKPGGTQETGCINVPGTRNNESDRLYIRNWPGETWTIRGDGSAFCAGFYAQSNESFQTFKGITFQDLDSTSQSVNGFAIFYKYGSSRGINIEQCEAYNINGSTNNAAILPWGTNGVKVWRCTFSNIQKLGDNYNNNTAGVLTYDGINISVQRCDIENAKNGIYHKRTVAGDTAVSARFNIFRTPVGVYYGASGSSGVSFSNTIVQSNLFLNCNDFGIHHRPGFNTTDLGHKHWWCSNIFDNVARGENAAITLERAYDAAIFNNIFFNCRKTWAEFTDSESVSRGVEYADYNHDHGTTLASQRYEWKGVNYSSAAALYTASGFANTDTQGDPLFDDTQYHLNANSPCKNSGVGGSDKGAYLIGNEILGATGEITPIIVTRPSPPSNMVVK
jgi:hypothetical protein